MKFRMDLLAVLLIGCALAVGCPKPNSTAENGGNSGSGGGGNGEEHAHHHEGDDALIWQRENLDHEGYKISLGHHGEKLFAEHHAEPTVMVAKDGEPVADAVVFVTLMDAAGEKVIAEEMKLTYEPPTDEEPAHYAQAEVELPDAKELTLRYRIELPEAGEFSQDVPVTLEKH